MKNASTKQALTLATAVFVSLGIGFYSGTKYISNKKPEFVNQFNQRNRDQAGQSRQILGASGQKTGGMPGGSRPVVGEVIANDSKTITIKQGDGSSKLVLISSTTTVSKAQPADTSSLLVGEKVSVFGNQNSDGSTTAQNIQINPNMPNASPSAWPKK